MPVRNDFQPGEFCWVDLTAHDLEAAAKWYGALFGWSHLLMETPEGAPPYAFFQAGEHGVGGLGQASEEMMAQGIPPMWNCYIATADCEATEAKAKALGATVTVPTMEVPGHGKLAFFMDPEGASIAVWQNLNPDGPGMLVGDPGGMCWTELMTRDTAKATEFYSDFVGWTCSEMPMGDFNYTMANVGDKMAAGMMPMIGEQYEGVPAHWMVYFSVSDCDATVTKAEQTGAQVHVPPMDIPVGRFSMLTDPQGAAFAVISLAGQPA